MKTKIPALALISLFSAGCNLQNSGVASKKKDDGKKEVVPQVARQVQSLKEARGTLNCAGMDEKLRFLRTRISFEQGELKSLAVNIFEDTSANPQPVHDLTPDLKKFEIYSSELTSKIVDFRKDLEGRHFEFEAFAAVNGQPAKIYELDIRAQSDGEGGSLLAATLEYRDLEAKLDLNEVFLSCVVLK